jgi:hypothetical protein
MALYYLMIDQDGAAELTRPIVKNRTFISAVERIYLSNAAGTKFLADDSLTLDNFEPQVIRK